MDDIKDGLAELAAACAEEHINLLALIGRTARWVHPDVFQELPLWYPERWRRQATANSTFSQILRNTNSRGATEDKTEANIYAERALVAALGLKIGQKPYNWSVCHIWGLDDPGFTKPNTIVQDARFYSCVGNMVLLPTPLKGLTDSDPDAKACLRVRAFELYRWVCPIDDSPELGHRISSGWKPDKYPTIWREPTRSTTALQLARRRKGEILNQLANPPGSLYPSDAVNVAMAYWGGVQNSIAGDGASPAVESLSRLPRSIGDTLHRPNAG